MSTQDVFCCVNKQTGDAYEKNKKNTDNFSIHVFDDALKLAHPKQTDDLASVANGRGGYPGDSSVNSVMNQGAPSGSNICVTPKIHDTINLKNKWGN